MGEIKRSSSVTRPLLSAFGLLLSAAALATPALATDHNNLEEGLPVAVEDAYPIGYGKKEVQGVFTYDHFTRNGGKELLTLEPRLALGLFPNFQATLRLPYQVGNADGRNSGTVSMGGLYQLNEWGPVFPVFALSAGLDVPYGMNESGTETRLKLIAQKTLGNQSENRDLHVNIEWTHNYSPLPDERSDRYSIGVGYAQPFNAETLLVVDLVGQQELGKGSNSMLIEFGIRHQLSEALVVSAGAGYRFAGQSEGFRFVFGFQRAVDWFGLK